MTVHTVESHTGFSWKASVFVLLTGSKGRLVYLLIRSVVGRNLVGTANNPLDKQSQDPRKKLCHTVY